MIFDGFGPPFGAPKSIKIDQKSISKFDRFLDAFCEVTGAPQGGGWKLSVLCIFKGHM